jgi:hypothetical protein
MLNCQNWRSLLYRYIVLYELMQERSCMKASRQHQENYKKQYQQFCIVSLKRRTLGFYVLNKTVGLVLRFASCAQENNPHYIYPFNFSSLFSVWNVSIRLPKWREILVSRDGLSTETIGV